MKAIVENETAALWRAYIKTRDVATRNQLVLQNLGLVHRISNQYAGLLPDAREDLFQEGCLALIRAVERFRPEYGLQFSTYAYPVISGIIKNYLRQRRRLLGHLWWSKDADDQEWQPRYDLMGGKGETLATPSDLEEFLGGVADDFADRVVDRILTETLLARIPPQERRLLRHMFYEDLTQREIAHELARSASRISRLARTALARVRSLLLDVQREEKALTTPAGGKALALASAVVDDETGLFGPDHLRRCLAREARRAQVYRGPLTLALLRPHHTALRSPTAALALTAERIYQSMRVLDHVFRAGPDELALIFPLPSPVARKVCERLRTSKPGLSLSYVTVSYPDDADSTDELLQVARRNLSRV